MASLAAIRTRLRAAPEDIAWLGVLPALALGLAACKWLAPWLGPDLLAHQSNDFFAGWQLFIHPEPVEQFRFLIAATLPFLLALAVVGLGARAPQRRPLDALVIAIQVAALVFVVVALTQQEGATFPSPPDYFDPLLLSVPNLIAGGVIGLLLTVAIVRGVDWPSQRLGALAGRLEGRWPIPLAIAAVATALWLLPAIVTDANIGQSGGTPSGHIPAQFEDYMAVANGRTSLVDFIPLYASLLPLAFGPLLPLFDSSITSFSIIECVLSLLALMAIYGVLLQVTRGPWIALALYVPFVAISLFPWTENGAQWEFNGNYYALFPNRYLGPFLVAWLWARHARRGSPSVAVVFFVAGLALLNNFEFGAACMAALVIAALVGVDPSQPVGRRLRSDGPQALIGVLVAVLSVSAVTLLRAGALPDPSILVYWTRTFAREGYGLVPMPTLGLHWALYATYASALLCGAVRQVRRAEDAALTTMLIFSASFGLASGQYFAGRSVPFQLMALFPVWGLCVALLTWTVSQSLRPARGDRMALRRLLVAGFAVMAAFGVMVAAIDRFPPPWRQFDRISATGTSVYDVPSAQRFVDARTEPGESVIIIGTAVDHRVAERAGVENVSPFGTVFSLFSAREMVRAIDALEDAGGDKFFEYAQAKGLGVRLPEVAQILRQRGYRLVATDPGSGLREWRRG